MICLLDSFLISFRLGDFFSQSLNFLPSFPFKIKQLSYQWAFNLYFSIMQD